jgi:hypothetical protein
MASSLLELRDFIPYDERSPATRFQAGINHLSTAEHFTSRAPSFEDDSWDFGVIRVGGLTFVVFSKEDLTMTQLLKGIRNLLASLGLKGNVILKINGQPITNRIGPAKLGSDFCISVIASGVGGKKNTDSWGVVHTKSKPEVPRGHSLNSHSVLQTTRGHYVMTRTGRARPLFAFPEGQIIRNQTNRHVLVLHYGDDVRDIPISLPTNLERLKQAIRQVLGMTEDAAFSVHKRFGTITNAINFSRLENGDHIGIHGLGVGGKRKKKTVFEALMKEPTKNLSRAAKEMRQVGASIGLAAGALAGAPELGQHIGGKMGAMTSKLLGKGDYKLKARTMRKNPSVRAPYIGGRTSGALSMGTDEVVEDFSVVINDVTLGASGVFTNEFYAVNPGTPNFLPRIVRYADIFNEFEIDQFIVDFIPLIPDFTTTTALPQVFITINPNANEPAYASEAEMQNSAGCVFGKASKPMQYAVECKKFAQNKYIMYSADNVNLPATTLYAFSLQIGSLNPTGSVIVEGTVVGKIVITGKIRFSSPINRDTGEVSSLIYNGVGNTTDYGSGQWGSEFVMSAQGDFEDAEIVFNTPTGSFGEFGLPSLIVGDSYFLNVTISLGSGYFTNPPSHDFNCFQAFSPWLDQTGTITNVDGRNDSQLEVPFGPPNPPEAAGNTWSNSYLYSVFSNSIDSPPTITCIPFQTSEDTNYTVNLTFIKMCTAGSNVSIFTGAS